MSWIAVEVEEGGDDFIAWCQHLQADLNERIRWALEECIKEWKWIVLSSTWFHPRPSPEADIIARYVRGTNEWTLEYGWRHYKGSEAKAIGRLELRKKIAHPMLLAFLAASIQGKTDS